MYKYSFTLKQHTPLVHHLGIKDWSGLQNKAVSPMLNKFLAEKITGGKGIIAKNNFKEKFKNACIHFDNKDWNSGECKQCNESKCEFRGWFRNKKDVESISFNYRFEFECKIDFEASYIQKIININHAHILYTDRKISGSVICTSTSLMKKIIELLPSFFILTGFGYRSSKGLGNFTMEGTSVQDYQGILNETYKANDQSIFYLNTTSDDNLIKEQISKSVVGRCKIIERRDFRPESPNDWEAFNNYLNKKYKGFRIEEPWGISSFQTGEFPKNLTNNICEKIKIPKEVFTREFSSNIVVKAIQLIIDQHWRYIKSGNNYPYYKSLLWMYFCGQNGNESGWEKRFMKESLKENHKDKFDDLKKKDESKPMRFETRNAPINYQFYRALLGLADHYEFARKNQRNAPNSPVVIKVEPEDPDIERIPSPVRFKVFDNTIYLIVDSVDTNIHNATFSFMCGNDKLKLGEIDRLSIQIPPNGLTDCFVEMLLNTPDLLSRVDPRFTAHPICNLYKQLNHE